MFWIPTGDHIRFCLCGESGERLAGTKGPYVAGRHVEGERIFMRVASTKGKNRWEIERFTGWEEVKSILGIEISTIDFPYKLVCISRRFTEPSSVRCGSAIRHCFINVHVVSLVVSGGVHRRLGHARLRNEPFFAAVRPSVEWVVEWWKARE